MKKKEITTVWREIDARLVRMARADDLEGLHKVVNLITELGICRRDECRLLRLAQGNFLSAHATTAQELAERADEIVEELNSYRRNWAAYFREQTQ